MNPKLSAALVAVAVGAVGVGIAVSGHAPPDLTCRARPAGVELSRCSRVCEDIGHGVPVGPCDPGEDNVMQPGHWVDNGGCVVVPCKVTR